MTCSCDGLQLLQFPVVMVHMKCRHSLKCFWSAPSLGMTLLEDSCCWQPTCAFAYSNVTLRTGRCRFPFWILACNLHLLVFPTIAMLPGNSGNCRLPRLKKQLGKCIWPGNNLELLRSMYLCTSLLS